MHFAKLNYKCPSNSRSANGKTWREIARVTDEKNYFPFQRWDHHKNGTDFQM